jgi:hypothetical protein
MASQKLSDTLDVNRAAEIAGQKIIVAELPIETLRDRSKRPNTEPIHIIFRVLVRVTGKVYSTALAGFAPFSM